MSHIDLRRGWTAVADLVGRKTAPIAGAAVVIATAVGLCLGVTSFLSNLLAGVVDFALGVVVALLLVDRVSERLAERRRSATWSTVRRQTYQMIRASLVNVVARVDLAYPISPQPDFYEQRPAEDVKPTLADISSLEDAAATIEKLGETAQGGGPAVPTREIFEQSQTDIVHLNDTITARVLAVASDPPLVERLLELAVATSRWQLALFLEDSESRTGQSYEGQIAWQPMAEFLRAGGQVLGQMAESE